MMLQKNDLALVVSETKHAASAHFTCEGRLPLYSSVNSS